MLPGVAPRIPETGAGRVAASQLPPRTAPAAARVKRGWLWLAPLLLGGALGGALAADEAGQQRRELQRLQQHIDSVEADLARTRDRQFGVAQELERLERDMARLTVAVRALEADVAERAATLERLQTERTRREAGIGTSRIALAGQLREAYVLGRQHGLKLLLNQDDPALVSRLLAYYRYLSDHRAGRIAALTGEVAQLRAVELAVAQEQEELDAARRDRAAEQARLEARRSRRQAVLAELEQALAAGDARLQALRRNAATLAELVAGLERDAVAGDAPRTLPLVRHRGGLAWPVAGRVAIRFGTPRAGGGLAWDGMVINAPEGREVRALYHGRVAFADWLRGFGMLLILDHGDGYMSLYGFNRSLLKETGEWVEAGEPVALVGDSGGRSQPGLYFALRHAGRPQDPGDWCRQARGGRTG
jgi:septal ring factor EnvC (AmiA/AmiB activator)